MIKMLVHRFFYNLIIIKVVMRKCTDRKFDILGLGCEFELVIYLGVFMVVIFGSRKSGITLLELY